MISYVPMKKTRCYLAVSNGELKSNKKWKSYLLSHLGIRGDVECFVFHSRHVKIWSVCHFPFPYSKSILVKDQTTHFDKELLILAFSVLRRSAIKKYSFDKAREIMLHYLFNMSGLSYRDELKYLKKKCKSHERFIKSGYTARMDHGWEIDELKKHKLIK